VLAPIQKIGRAPSRSVAEYIRGRLLTSAFASVLVPELEISDVIADMPNSAGGRYAPIAILNE
jgi:hypothetical protein